MKHLYIPQLLASQTQQKLPVTENASFEEENFFRRKKITFVFLFFSYQEADIPFASWRCTPEPPRGWFWY
jgi:hypothetical protein